MISTQHLNRTYNKLNEVFLRATDPDLNSDIVVTGYASSFYLSSSDTGMIGDDDVIAVTDIVG